MNDIRVTSREKNDCTVTAYANAFGVSYEIAYATLAKAGRQPGKMFDFRKVGLENICDRKIPYEVSEGGQTYQFETRLGHGNLKEVITRLGKGKYIVATPKHIFAVINGNIIDYKEGNGRHVREVYEVK